MTNFPDLFASLAAPFDAGEVKTLPAKGNARFVTARTVMNRLDNVLGPESWWDSYRPGGDNSVICRLTVVLPDGRELTKEDAGGAAGMADAGDDDKSAVSDAFKRAAVKFGVARYLYRDGVPTFAGKAEPGADPVEPGHATRPASATNGNGHHHKERHDWGTATAPANGKQHDGPPRSGKALFAWCKSREEQHQVGLLKYLNGWSKLQDFPGRMVEWDAEQVALAHAEAVRKLATIGSDG